MKIKEVIRFLEQVAPPSYQESYDNAGLITGDPQAEVSGALLSLDCTEVIVQEAIDKGCNLIIAHHPIVFRGLKSLTGRNYVERTVIKAIKADIAIYAIHTNLDHVHTGVNSMICRRLGLQNARILQPKSEILSKITFFVPTADTDKVLEALYATGAGQIGNYSHCSFRVEGTGTFKPGEAANPHIGETGGAMERVQENRVELMFPSHLSGAVINALQEAHPYEEVAYYLHSLQNKNQEVGAGMIAELAEPMDELDFLRHIKQSMQASVIRHTALRGKKIKKVAVCGGAGGFLLSTAIGRGADIFITADYKYHEFFDADDRIIIADIGHYESEQFTKELLFELLSENFANFTPRLSEVNTNPINYFI